MISTSTVAAGLKCPLCAQLSKMKDRPILVERFEREGWFDHCPQCGEWVDNKDNEYLTKASILMSDALRKEGYVRINNKDMTVSKLLLTDEQLVEALPNTPNSISRRNLARTSGDPRMCHWITNLPGRVYYKV